MDDIHTLDVPPCVWLCFSRTTDRIKGALNQSDLWDGSPWTGEFHFKLHLTGLSVAEHA